MSKRSVWLERLVVTAALLLIVWGIGSYGIWSPWELEDAEAARALWQAGSTGSALAPLSTHLIGLAFEAFGLRPWAARLPGVMAALLTSWLAFVVLRSALDRRAAIVGVVVLATTPAFLLNARLVMGASVEVAAQSAVGVAALGLALRTKRPADAAVWGLAWAASAAASTVASGVLLGPLPPSLAVAAWSLIATHEERGVSIGRWVFAPAALIMTAGVARAVSLDSPEPTLWLGGGSTGGNPPTFEAAFEALFHGLAPWSAALPVAAVWMLTPRPGRRSATQTIAWIFLLWSVFSFVAWTVFASRYGTPAYLALLPLSGLVALWMTEVSREPAARWGAAVTVVALIALLVRDFALYPESPLRSLPVEGVDVPEGYAPGGSWASLFAFFAVVLSLFLVGHEGVPRPRPKRLARWVRNQWSSGWVPRIWLLLAFWLVAACLVFGSLCWLWNLPLPSVVARIGQAAFFVPFAAVALIWGAPWLRHAIGKLGDDGAFLVLAGGLAVGAFVVCGFQPGLGRHFSPQPVYETYAELADQNQEPLAVYRSPATAAEYHTEASVQRIDSEDTILAFLDQPGRRWVVMPAEELAPLDRRHRARTGSHLYVADARSARLLLVASSPVEGRPNASFLEDAVLREAPEPEHVVRINFADRVELLGYDLSTPTPDGVGAGQRFEITWYWRALDEPPEGYTVFVHIDGYGRRLNGDHEPVAGRYPPKLWEAGDVIVDRQELVVPASFRRGDYEIFVGWFRGKNRLEVRSGADDGEDRVRVGTLRVR